MWDVKPCSTQLNASNEARLDDRSDRPASMSICSNVTLRRVPNFELLMLTAEQSTSAVLCPATSTNWPSHCNSRYCHAAAAGCSTGRPIGRNNDVKSDTVIIRQSLFFVDSTQCHCARQLFTQRPTCATHTCCYGGDRTIEFVLVHSPLHPSRTAKWLFAPQKQLSK